MSNLMRPCLAVLLAVGALAQMPIFTVTAAEREATVVDGIAAVVNGEVITYSQVRALSAPQERMLRQQYTGAELAKKLTELRELAVKDLIDRGSSFRHSKKKASKSPITSWICEYNRSLGNLLAVTATPLSKRSRRKISR
jgi:hypothetical protein